MSIFKRIEKRAVSVSLTDPEAWWRDIEPGAPQSYTGKNITRHTALQTSAVYYCAGLIADAIASLPLDTFIKTGNRRKQIDTPAWLVRPNPNMTPIDFWHRVVTSMLLEGNAFILTIRDPRDNEIVALYPIHPDYVDIEDNPNGNLYHIGGQVLTQKDILHIPGFTLAGETRGYSVLSAAKQSIGLGLTTEEFGARFFGQGTTMSGVIEVPSSLDPKEARRLKADFSKSNAGVKNSHAIGVLTGGAVWRPVSITPDEAQFLETRKFSKVDIALFFRVPPHMVDPTVSSTWGTGVEEQNWAFVQNTIQPWLTRLEQAITLYLLPEGQQVHFNLDSRLRAKTTERMDAFAKGLEHGVYCQDDLRAMEDLPPLPNGLGKKFYVPANLIEVGAPKPEPQAPAPAPAADPKADPNADPNAQPQEQKSFRYNHNHGADGKFTTGPYGAEPIYQSQLSNPDTPRTRGVTREHFNELAAEGKKRLDGFQKNASEPTAFTDEKSWQAVKDRAWEESRPEWGGSTIDGHSGKFMSGKEDAYALTVKPRNLEPVSVSPTASRAEFDKAMDTARERFGKQLSYENHKLGVFNDADSKRIDIDPVLVVKSKHDVETIGAHTHAVGGAYRFSDGNGYWPPYVIEEGGKAA